MGLHDLHPQILGCLRTEESAGERDVASNTGGAWRAQVVQELLDRSPLAAVDIERTAGYIEKHRDRRYLPFRIPRAGPGLS